MRTAVLDKAAALGGSRRDREGAVGRRAGESGGECEEGGAEEEEELDHDGGHGDWFGLCCYCDGGFDGDRVGLLLWMLFVVCDGGFGEIGRNIESMVLVFVLWEEWQKWLQEKTCSLKYPQPTRKNANLGTFHLFVPSELDPFHHLPLPRQTSMPLPTQAPPS